MYDACQKWGRTNGKLNSRSRIHIDFTLVGFKKYFSIIVVCRLFLLLVLISMIAELGGIITLNVLGQVCQHFPALFDVFGVFVDSWELHLLTTVNYIC